MDIKVTGLALTLISIILLTITQVIIKSRLSVHGAIPFSLDELLAYGWTLLRDWKLLAGLVTLVVAAFCWYAAISRLPLSMVFPFGALSYPLVLAGSLLFLHEEFNWQAVAGNGLIVAGVLLVASAT